VVDALAAAGYPDVAALDAGQGNDAADLCVLNNGTSVQAFQGLPRLYPLPPPPHIPGPGANGVAPTVPPTRYQIDVTKKDMVDILPQAWDAVVALNNPPTLFRRDTALLSIKVADGVARLEPINQTRMRGIVARSVLFIEQKHTGRAPWLKPDGAIVDDMLVNIDPRIQPIDRIAQVPVFDSQGNLIDQSGYHPAARLYYHPRPGLNLQPIPAQPTKADLNEAKDLIYNDLRFSRTSRERPYI
jgi:hypothetical protein